MNSLENEWYIQVPWGRISIIAWGSCYDPPVLLCHGSVDSAASFRPLVKLLPKNFYYIGIEWPGSGKSDRFPPGFMYSIYDLVYSVEAVAKHFRWETFVFIGHSLGAAIGKLYNVSNPGKLSKLVELDPINFYGIPPEEFPKWYEYYYIHFFENYEKYNMAKGTAPKITRDEAINTLKKKRGFTDELAIATLERWTEPAGDGLLRYTYDPRIRLIQVPPLSPEHIRDIYTSVTTPILCVLAAASVSEGLFRNTSFLQDEAAYPARNCRVRTVRGEHDVHVVAPDRLATYIGAFLLAGLEGLDSKAKL